MDFLPIMQRIRPQQIGCELCEGNRGETLMHTTSKAGTSSQMFPPFAFHLATLCKESCPFTACRAANRRLPGSGPSPVVAKGLVVGGDDVVEHVHLPEAALIGDVDLPRFAQVLHRQHGDLVLLQLVVFVFEKVAQKVTKS